jgi:hypothetical protein
LGQTPFAPTSAKERGERREDRVVRRVLKKNGDVEGSSASESGESEGEEEVTRRRGKGREKATEVIIEAGDLHQDDILDTSRQGNASVGGEGAKRKRNRSSKKVRLFTYWRGLRSRELTL